VQYLHLYLRVVHRGVSDQRMRGLWVLVAVVLVLGLAPDVGVVEQPEKPRLDATEAVRLSDV